MKYLLAAILLLSISMAKAQTPMSLSSLKDSLETILQKEHIPGLMVALVNKDSIIWAGGVGYADLDKKTKVNENHLFRIGSISKSFTALAILQLVDQGKFTLGSKLLDLAPEIPFANEWETESPVRVIHLLEHTAGFDDMHFAAFLNKEGPAKTTLSQALAHVKALHSRWRPGTRMAYSNPGYAILGFLIEKYSGKKYEKYVEENIFHPLDMGHTNFEYQLREPYALGYSYKAHAYHQAPPVEINGNAAGAISSCALDMARYVRLYLNEGKKDVIRVMPAVDIHEMETTHSTLAARAGLKTGYGLANRTKLIGTKVRENFRGHDGGIMGFSSDFGYSREWGVGYAISNNGEASNRKITTKIVEYLLQGKTSALPIPQPLNYRAIQPYLGTYKLRSSRNQILVFTENLLATANLFIENDTLYLQKILGDKDALIPCSQFQFRKKNDTAPTIVLTRDGETNVMFVESEYLAKVNTFTVWLDRIVIGITLLSGIVLMPLGTIWLFLLIIKKLKRKMFIIRILPLCAFISFCAMIYAFIDLVDLTNITTAATINWRTVTIFAGSISLPLFSILSLYQVFRNFQNAGNRAIRFFLVSSSLGFCYLSFYLFQFGWIGMRIWTY